MKKISGYYSFIFLLMTIAFVGQSSASLLMTCHLKMSQQTVQQSTKSTKNTISAEAFAQLPPCHQEQYLAQQVDVQTAQVSSSDCCNDKCNCAAAACTSLFLLQALPINTPTQITCELSERSEDNVLSTYLSNLYKPPIAITLA